MGIYITLKRVGKGITKEEWKGVYQETLQALEHYPFADKVLVKAYGRDKYYQVEQTKERELVPLQEGRGWQVVGDLDTCQYGESFILMVENDHYVISIEDNTVQDILECVAEDKRCVTIWDSKTQGEPYHIPLLAIGCLIEDRLEGRVLVQGNIRRVEVEEACEWINKHVDKEVGFPVVADPQKLITRLCKIYSRVEDILNHFYSLYIDILDNQIREIMEQTLGSNVVWHYYQEQLGKLEVGMREFVDLAEQMLKIGYSLEELAVCLVESKERSISEIEVFIRHILEERVSVYCLPKEEVYIAGNVEGQMVTMFDALLGYNRNKYYISEKERGHLANRLKDIFPEYIESIEEILIEAVDKKKKQMQRYQEYVDMLESALDQQRAYIEEYDIVATYQLVEWEKGDTLLPDIDEQLNEVIELCKKTPQEIESMRQVINKLKYDQHFEYMLREKSRSFLLPKSSWHYIIESWDNERVLMVIMSLMRIDVTSAKHYQLVKAILCNPKIIQDYILERVK